MLTNHTVKHMQQLQDKANSKADLPMTAMSDTKFIFKYGAWYI
jgi:hypothetical protein